MNNTLHHVASAWSLVSRIPVPLAREPDYSHLGFWMPVLGLAAAATSCAGAWLGLVVFGSEPLAALAAMSAQYLGFNLFHLDGLLDTADSAGVFGDENRRRTALKDPHVGSFALFAGFVVLAGRLAATTVLLTRGSAAAWGALVLAPVSGRLAAMLVPSMAEPHPSAGLASSIGRPSPVAAATGYAVAAAAASVLFGISFGPIGSVASILTGGLIAIVAGALPGHWYSTRMGGYSGDALGAAVELGELFVLLLAAAIV
ncbi:MAG: adenosylcobinamide-GDP ribazoletransferase [Spirochaetales bacterium]|nr:adenosylcobinamide-GDP ribazoletransferase [Spirochaetales bacterium]